MAVVKRLLSRFGRWAIFKLHDGCIKGSGYRYKINKKDNTKYRQRVIIKSESVIKSVKPGTFKIVPSSARVEDGWRPATANDVEKSMAAVKRVLSRSGRWAIFKLQDGCIKGSGYRYKIDKKDKTNWRQMVIIKSGINKIKKKKNNNNNKKKKENKYKNKCAVNNGGCDQICTSSRVRNNVDARTDLSWTLIGLLVQGRAKTSLRRAVVIGTHFVTVRTILV